MIQLFTVREKINIVLREPKNFLKNKFRKEEHFLKSVDFTSAKYQQDLAWGQTILKWVYQNHTL